MAEAARMEELGRDECYALLAGHPARVGRVAIAGPRPVILPVNYALDGEDVVFRVSSASQLGRALEETFVAFEVDEVDPAWRRGWSVVVRGKAVAVDDGERARLLGLDLRPWAPGERDRFVRLRADIVTGRRIVG